jgi:hypothetical protein
MDWFDQLMFREMKSGIVRTLGYNGVAHAWAYLPDLSRAFEALASVRGTLKGFDRFHFAGHFVTREQMRVALEKAATAPVKIKMFWMPLLSVVGLFDPIVRESAKMRYIWKNAMELRDERLEEILGKGFNTPFDQAVAATVAPFFEEMAGSVNGKREFATA